MSLKFEEKIKKNCGIVFYNSSGIVFKNEGIKNVTRFFLYTNDKKKKKIELNFSNIRKSDNLTNVSNSQIYLVIDKNQKIRVNDALSKNLKLKEGIHSIYIKIEQERNHVISGFANIHFDIETICKN
jgi:phosphatidate phosphatase PAH1